MASSEEEDGGSELSWSLELEAALLGAAEGADVRSIAKCRPVPDELRAAAWLACLDIQHDVDDQLMTFTNIYDLPEQGDMRSDIRQLVDRLGNEEEDRVSVMSDVESVLTHYCKSQREKYSRDNGWVDILQPLVSLRLNKPELYFALNNILQRYIPKHCGPDSDPYHLLRLLLLYHEPELCNLLDTKKVPPDTYAAPWLKSLFAATCDLKAIQVMWDIYFQMDDPFLIFFLSLVMLVNAKEQILELKDRPREQIISTVTSLPCFLQADDVPDFCHLANFYSLRTPKSFRRKLYPSLFGVCAPHLSSLLTATVPLSQSLCLPVYVDEILASMDSHTTAGPDSQHSDTSETPSTVVDQVQFFLVDCRPADQYNAGHLPTAFHLDCTLMLYDPAAFNTAVSALLNAQQQASAAHHSAAGEHLCFIGSGREKEDQFVHMVVASFLQKRSLYVSKVEGGYQAFHDALSESLSSLADHSVQQCVVCSPEPDQPGPPAPQPVQPAGSLLDRLGARWRTRGQRVRERLVEVITNSAAEPAERHVSSRDRGRRYRNMAPVFSLDDEQDTEELEEEVEVADVPAMELVEINEWLKKPEVLHQFRCQHIKENRYAHPSVLLVTSSQLYVLRELPARPGWAHLAAKRSLTSIVQITSKKKRPELITFKYGLTDNEQMTVTDMDRFYIPKAGDATKAVKLAIIQLSEEQTEGTEGGSSAAGEQAST